MQQPNTGEHPVVQHHPHPTAGVYLRVATILVILTVIACFTASRLARPFRTARGTAVLAALRRLFARLRTRGRSLQAKTGNADAALLAAVFGLGALPAPAFGYARKLYPRPASGDSGSGACGSSCGSGCGGGCGGCGGGGGD